MASRVHKTPERTVTKDETTTEEETTSSTKQEAHDKMLADIDAVLDDIDSVLEEEAATFIREFVQKGGQ